eukprot:c4846_g1_i1.p1 GENE.c4846_g1_i1~~c4846_g1_i1.p1  ORF type:complete len:178 (-),score=6.11 c4846_g1_i1:4-537(-)
MALTNLWLQRTRVGTTAYNAPELLIRKSDYDYRIDIWSLGIIMASIIFQRFPFMHAEDDIDQLQSIIALSGLRKFQAMLNQYNFTLSSSRKHLLDFCYPEATSSWEQYITPDNSHLCSSEALDLLNKLLAIDPKERLSAKQALKHDYFLPIRECWAPLSVGDWPYEYSYYSFEYHCE